MIDVHTVNKKKQRKYIDFYNRKEKKINVHTINQKKAKKVHKFFAIQKKKKMIDMHVVNKKAKKVNKKKQRFNQPIISTPDLI